MVSTSEFDLARRVTRTVDGEGIATTYAYDAHSRLSEVKGPDGRSVRTIYGEFGDKTEEQLYGETGTYLGKSTFKVRQAGTTAGD